MSESRRISVETVLSLTVSDDNSDSDEDIEAQKQQPSPVKKKSKKKSKESKKSTLQAPKQHIDVGTSKARKREKKDSSSLKKPPQEKLSTENSAPLDPPSKSVNPAKKKKKRKKTPVETTDAKKSADENYSPAENSGVEEDKKMSPQKPNGQNSKQTSPPRQSDISVEKNSENARVTTKAARTTLAGNVIRSGKGNSGNGTKAESDGLNHEDGDHSVSTAPLPPSLRVQEHHSLQPGAYRMYTGGAARYVNSAGDDIDDDYSTSYDQSSSSRVDTAVTIEAYVVKDEPPPPRFLPTESGTLTAESTFAITSATPTGITYASVAIDEEDSSKDKDGGTKTRRIKYIVCFVVFSIIIIASILAASAVRRMNRNNRKQDIGVDVDQLTPSMNAFVDALPQYTIAALAINDSDQSKALDWIFNVDDLDSFPLDRQLQRFALITLFYATTSQDLSAEILAWLASRDECDWYESECIDDIYTELSLRSENRLTGTIVPELALLTSLKSLLLDENDLEGTIPTQLGEMTTLEKLHMNDNAFQGKIPTEFGKLTSIKDINLSTNQLLGKIPTEIGMWTNVEKVMLENNALVGTMPTEIGRMTQLVSFSVSSNALEGELPSSIVRLLRMESFNAEKNFFSGRFLPQLENIELDGFIGRGGSLKYLKLRENEFTGTLPTTIGFLQNLVHLDLSKNAFKSNLPTEVGLLTSLTSLKLHSNRLDDSIPIELSVLSNLEEMLLHHNLFTGTLPFDICQIPNLQKEDLTIDCARVFCLCCHCGPRNSDDGRDGPPKSEPTAPDGTQSTPPPDGTQSKPPRDGTQPPPDGTQPPPPDGQSPGSRE